MILMTIALLIGLIVIYHIYKYQTNWKYINKFPGEKTLPFIGNTHNFGIDSADNHKTLFDLVQKYDSKAFRVWIGYNGFLILTDAKDIEFVLASNTLLKKSIIYNLLHKWLGEGLLTSSGIKWFKHRKVITPSFHFKILRDFFVVMKEKSNIFVEKLSEKSKTGEIFDIQDMIHYCTLDVICETAMGTEINAMDEHDSILVKSFQDICYVLQRRVFHPVKFFNFLWSTIYRFTSEFQIERNSLKVLKSFTMDVIEKRRKILKENETGSMTENMNEEDNESEMEHISKTKYAFLDTLLMAKIDDRPLNNQELYEEVATFMFEGHDTTTSGITFTIHTLSRHPEVQAKVYQEQVSIFGVENLKNVDPTFQNIQDMKYLELVIKESLRLYPSVPIIARDVNQPTYFNGKYVPTGTTLLLFIMGMGYNKEYFPDPYKFNPDRFNDRITKNVFDYVPFSAGQRNCIGQKFASLEMKSLISNIIRNFEILPASDECLQNGGYEYLGSNNYDPIFTSLLTLKSNNGVHVRLRSRNGYILS